MRRLSGTPYGGRMFFGYVNWIVLGLVAWALLGGLVALILMRASRDRDRATRLAQKTFIAHSDDTVTAAGF